MEDNVRKRTFPIISASPASFVKVLVAITAVICMLALQQNLISLPLNWLLQLFNIPPLTCLSYFQWLSWEDSHVLQKHTPRQRPGVSPRVDCCRWLIQGLSNMQNSCMSGAGWILSRGRTWRQKRWKAVSRVGDLESGLEQGDSRHITQRGAPQDVELPTWPARAHIPSLPSIGRTN